MLNIKNFNTSTINKKMINIIVILDIIINLKYKSLNTLINLLITNPTKKQKKVPYSSQKVTSTVKYSSPPIKNSLKFSKQNTMYNFLSMVKISLFKIKIK